MSHTPYQPPRSADQHYLSPGPVKVHVVEQLTTFERVLTNIKNVIVIVTCLAVLYTLWVVYNAMAEFGDNLRQAGL